MPPLTEEQLEQIRYVSVKDYCERVDQIESIEDKLAFSTRYILSYGMNQQGQPDHPIDHIIKAAHMKIADKSADLKKLWHETEANKGKGETMVNPNVNFYGEDFANQMFIANPVGYLKGKAQELSDEIHSKQWMSDADIQLALNYSVLRNETFTDEFAASMSKYAKKPTVDDFNTRLENAFGGPKAFKKALDATKPGILSSMFGTRSVAAANLDAAYKAFNNPNHANHGNLPTVEKAAKEYLQHVLPNWNPDGPTKIPTLQDVEGLSGTQLARAKLSIHLLNAAKEQKDMEVSYQETVEAASKRDYSYESLIPNQKDKIIFAEDQNDFQKQVLEDVAEDKEDEIDNAEEENDMSRDSERDYHITFD